MRANEWAVQANERMDERVAQYFSLYSWLFWPTVHFLFRRCPTFQLSVCPLFHPSVYLCQFIYLSVHHFVRLLLFFSFICPSLFVHRVTCDGTIIFLGGSLHAFFSFWGASSGNIWLNHWLVDPNSMIWHVVTQKGEIGHMGAISGDSSNLEMKNVRQYMAKNPLENSKKSTFFNNLSKLA